MALTLKQRELSLSRGNKDLFILHTAGLDLMESLDLETLAREDRCPGGRSGQSGHDLGGVRQ